jgi:CRISPR/Cas system-associated endonuclease Cas1
VRRTLSQEAEYVPWGNREAAQQWIEREIGRLQAILEVYQQKETLELAALKATLALPSKEVVDKILRYETATSRQLYKAMGELERLQRTRKGEPVPPPISVEISKEG